MLEIAVAIATIVGVIVSIMVGADSIASFLRKLRGGPKELPETPPPVLPPIDTSYQPSDTRPKPVHLPAPPSATTYKTALGDDTNDDQFTHKDVVSFRGFGQEEPIAKWWQLLVRLCQIIAALQPTKLQRVHNMTLNKGNKPYITTDNTQLNRPTEVLLSDGSSLFVETTVSNKQVVQLARALLKKCDYDPHEVIIEYKDQ